MKSKPDPSMQLDRDQSGRHDVRGPCAKVGPTRSFYITMRDGVQLAVDLTLPEGSASGPSSQLPTILRQTRYFRAVAYAKWFQKLGFDNHLDMLKGVRSYFVSRGYAWVDVCVRGSGASGGTRPCPWHDNEIADGGELVDWIIAQTWSNGRVGSMGVSYEGTTAEMLLVNKHPAVKAIIPRFSLYDAYTDVAFPGGVHLAWFTHAWGLFNDALDANDHNVAIGKVIQHQLRAWLQYHQDYGNKNQAALFARLVDGPTEKLVAFAMRAASGGVRPTDDDDAADVLAAHVHEHAGNYDVHDGAKNVVYRDDTGVSAHIPDRTIDSFSPHTYAQQLRESGTAIYGYSGWFDGAYQNAAIKRFRDIETPGNKLIIGPWDHGGAQHISPRAAQRWTAFDHDAERLRFLDAHLLEATASTASLRVITEPAVRYYTMGQEAWKSSTIWPPRGTKAVSLFACSGDVLSTLKPTDPTSLRLQPKRTGTSGNRTRWKTYLGLRVPVGHGGVLGQEDTSLVLRTAPLTRPVEITGHPVANLWLTVNGEDATLFVYLQEQDQEGRWETITEGQLRLLHRKTHRATSRDVGVRRSFLARDGAQTVPGKRTQAKVELLPTSYEVPAGHRIQLVIRLADSDNFAPITGGATALDLLVGGRYASTVTLPCMTGGASL